MVKTRLFEALLSCLAALAERSRLVVVFEDLQWADSASVEVLDFLTRNLGDSPVLLIGTFRSDEIERDQSLDRMVAELGRHRAVSSIELAGLDREATAAIMAKSLGRRPEWALLEAVYARCEGNPFLAQELTAARDMTSLPSGLRRVVMLRVERLTAEARHVVNIAAAAGASIDHRLLVTVADDLDAQSVTLAVNEAVRRQVLTVDGRSHFRFRHALQREAVYEGLLPSERARLHRRIAIALRENPELGSFGPGQAIVELAGHWWHSEEWSEALPASIAAGEAAAALLAMPETYVHYGRALTACERLPEDLGRRAIDYVGLLLKAADAAYLTGAVQRSVELARAALGALDFDREPRRAAVAFTTLGRNALADGDGDGAFEAFHRAVELLSRDSPSVELAAATAEQARAHMLVSRFEDAATHCHDAIAIAQAVGARAEEGHALNTLGVCIAEQHGDFDAGIALLGRARAIAEEIGHPDDLNRAYANLTHVLMSAGRLEETARVVFDGIAQGERLVGVRLNGAGQNSAEALIRLGRWDEADDLLSRMDDHGVGSCVFGPQAVRAALAIRRGRFDIAAERLEAADTFSAGLASVQVRGWFHMLSAELALEKRQPTQASEDIERALNIAAGTDDNMYRPEMCALGVRALADEHDTARARGRAVDSGKALRLAMALVEQAEHHVGLSHQDGPGGATRGGALLAMCQAEASRLGAPDPDRWRTAAARWEAIPEPYHVAYCRLREAEAALATPGGRSRATDALRAAWQTSVRIGAPPLQARIERLAQLARFNLATASQPPSPWQSVADDLGLTPREVEVLARLARGRSDRQIADELYISRKTASVHVSNILRKLGAANRIEAGEIGQQAGLT